VINVVSFYIASRSDNGLPMAVSAGGGRRAAVEARAHHRLRWSCGPMPCFRGVGFACLTAGCA